MGKKSKKSGNGLVAGRDTSLRALLRVPRGPVDVASFDPRATPGFPGKGKSDVAEQTDLLAPRLDELQERLFAAGRADPESAQRVLVVLQGMDTSGKGGVIRHTFGLVDPQGVQLKGFKAPDAEERKHDFLWRIRKALPQPGEIGIFDRSHYEDVLVARVDELVPVRTWTNRYDAINRFEAGLVDEGYTLVKCWLNVSPQEQKARLAARLDNPEKYWKYNPGDLDSRAKWPAYMEAYADLLERCNTDEAPWYAIPADRKWYRNWAVAQILLETLESMDLGWPAADFDVAEQKKLVDKS